MPHQNRIDIGNIIYHVINRANAKIQIFNDEKNVYYLKNYLKRMGDNYGFIVKKISLRNRKRI